MKTLVEFAGEIIIFALLCLFSLAIEASTAIPVVSGNHQVIEPLPISTKPPAKLPDADDAVKKGAVNSVEGGKELPPQALSLTEQHQERRGRSLFLFLQILRSAK